MKKGAILAVSLGFIALLTSVIYLFLQLSVQNKNNLNQEYITLQMSGLVANLSQYLKELEFDDEMLFYASRVKLPIEVGQVELLMSIKSANSTVSFNGVIGGILQQRQSKERILGTKIEDKFNGFLRSFRVNNPNYLIDLFLDTMDKDEEERSYKSEMVKENARFFNGQIDSLDHLREILDYYALTQNDANVYDIPWEKIFNFNNVSGIDLNHVSIEALNFLFFNENSGAFRQLTRHEKWFEEVKDLPLSESLRKEILGSRYGMEISIQSSVALIEFEVLFQGQKALVEMKKTLGKGSFIYDIKITQKGKYEQK